MFLVLTDVGQLELDLPDQQVVLRLQVTIGVRPRMPVSIAAFCSCQPMKLLTPAYRILPASRRRRRTRSVSSIASTRPRACAW